MVVYQRPLRQHLVAFIERPYGRVCIVGKNLLPQFASRFSVQLSQKWTRKQTIRIFERSLSLINGTMSWCFFHILDLDLLKKRLRRIAEDLGAANDVAGNDR